MGKPRSGLGIDDRTPTARGFGGADQGSGGMEYLERFQVQPCRTQFQPTTGAIPVAMLLIEKEK